MDNLGFYHPIVVHFALGLLTADALEAAGQKDAARAFLQGLSSDYPDNERIRNALVLGADYYETIEEIERANARGLPPLGIGPDSLVERAIVDKNARIGRGVRLVNEAKAGEKDGDGYYIRDGIVIVPKDGVIPDGAVI